MDNYKNFSKDLKPSRMSDCAVGNSFSEEYPYALIVGAEQRVASFQKFK